MIHSYFAEVQKKFEKFSTLMKETNIDFNVISSSMGIIKGRICFIDNSVLDFRELYSDSEHDYRFHYMDKNKKLIARWDTAPHFPKLENFPFHKHLIEKSAISSEERFLSNIIDEIAEIVAKNIVKNI